MFKFGVVEMLEAEFKFEEAFVMVMPEFGLSSSDGGMLVKPPELRFRLEIEIGDVYTSEKTLVV